MQRLIDAFRNSMRALSRLARSETAVRQELVLLALAVPVAWWLADTWPVYLMLIGSVLLLILVEVLNTAVESACNAITRDFNRDIQLAKDCGSLAVLIAIVLTATAWLSVIWQRFAG